MAIGSQSSFLRVRPTLWFGECEQTGRNGQKNLRSAEAIRRVRRGEPEYLGSIPIDSPRAGGRNTGECSARARRSLRVAPCEKNYVKMGIRTFAAKSLCGSAPPARARR